MLKEAVMELKGSKANQKKSSVIHLTRLTSGILLLLLTIFWVNIQAVGMVMKGVHHRVLPRAPRQRRQAITAVGLILSSVVALSVHAQSLMPEYGVFGTQRQFDKSVEVGDPISAGSGAFSWSKQLASLGGPMNFDFSIHYRTDPNAHYVREPGDFPPGAFFEDTMYAFLNAWRWQPSPMLMGNSWYDMTVLLEDGGQVCFSLKDDNFVPTSVSGISGSVDRHYQLEKIDDWFYFFDPRRERITMFQLLPAGGTRFYRPETVMDRNGNRLTYTYRFDRHANPSAITDDTGRALNFDYEWYEWGSSWNIRYRLSTVTDHAGRVWRFVYDDEAADNGGRMTLRAVVGPDNGTSTFVYQPNTFSHPSGNLAGDLSLLVSVVEPLGNTRFSNEYTLSSLGGKTEPHVRISRQTDAYDNTITLAYAADTNLVTETRPDGQIVAYTHHHNHGTPKSITDPAGKILHVGQTDREQINTVTDRMGDTTTITYHPETGRIASITDAEGRTVTRTYTPQEQTFTNPANDHEITFTFYNLTRLDYPDGTFETFTHDAHGNVLTHTDRSGRAWTFTYNVRGQMLSLTNPAEGVITITYNDDGTVKTATDTDTDVTTYGYDKYKRVNRITYPGGAVVQLDYDLNDRITSLTNENGHQTRFAYDLNGNLVKITDPGDLETLFEYDLMDRLVKTTDRLGRKSFRSYDVMGRLAEIRDGTGVTTSFGYDPRGWRNQTTRAGRTWATAYDDEGVPVSFTTPLTRSVEQVTDKLGWTRQITDGEGGETVLARDVMNRVSAVTDPNNLTTVYSYDGQGRLARIILPTEEYVTYVYNDLGLLERIADLNRRLWRFTYSSMGRIQSITDPLNRSTGYAHDKQGQLNTIAFPDGGALTITQDPAGNVIRRQYSGGPDLAFTFDVFSRLLTTEGLSLTRDPEGRILSTADSGSAFRASYDQAGRLATAGYRNDAFVVTYTYDTGEDGTGLLTGVSDSLTGTTVSLGYDDDDRLRTVVLPNGETITYTWDNAGRLTRLQSGYHVDLVLSPDTSGRITGIEHTAPLDSVNHLEAATKSLTFDAASQIQTAGYAHDSRGRVTATPHHAFTWDGASRLTGINDTVLTYNGLGDIRTRTRGSETIRFHHNRAFGLGSIVAEEDASTGDFLRYYIYTPGGRLLYMIDAAQGNQVYFYHFNQVGSTLALTDMKGTVTDAWAYDPYGRILARTGTSAQPFTFSGAWGVRQEGEDGLYQMRARYYDANTGRFLSPEPIWPQISDPKALNPYQYAGADPVRFVDPAGLQGGNVNDLLNQAKQLHEKFEKANDELYSANYEFHCARETFSNLEKDQANDLSFIENFNESAADFEAEMEALGVEGARQWLLKQRMESLEDIAERRPDIEMARVRMEKARQQAERVADWHQRFLDVNRASILKILYKIRDRIAKEEQLHKNHFWKIQRRLQGGVGEWRRLNQADVDGARQIENRIKELKRLEFSLGLYAPRD
jgi:RHS repeat-associated protein